MYVCPMFYRERSMITGMFSTRDMCQSRLKILTSLLKIWQGITEKVWKYSRRKRKSLRLHRPRNQPTKKREKESRKNLSKSLHRRLKFLWKSHQESFLNFKSTWRKILVKFIKNSKIQWNNGKNLQRLVKQDGKFYLGESHWNLSINWKSSRRLGISKS